MHSWKYDQNKNKIWRKNLTTPASKWPDPVPAVMATYNGQASSGQ